MAKNKSGAYVPPKGKPTGSGRETHPLKDAFAVTDPETENEIAEKYTKRHVNRNLHKGEDMSAEDSVNNDK
jgi:hypothetical protein